MTGERVLVASADSAPFGAGATDSEDSFASQIQGALPASFRLAAVILGDISDAEDATQDAVERAWRSRSKLRDADRFDAWFQRILVNSCVDRVRRRRGKPLLVSFEASHPEPTGRNARFEDPADRSAQRDSVRRALDKLNVDPRVVIAMRFFLDLEVDEIARRLGTPSGTVKSRLHRGLRDLRAAWETNR